MRILAITNMYPSAEHPSSGLFIQQQIKGLRNIGVDVDLLIVDRLKKGKQAYWGLGPQIRGKIKEVNPRLVHCMYGGVMADIVTRTISDTPVVVTFHGSDLLGENLSGLLRKWYSRYGVWCSKRAAQRSSGIVVVSSVLQEILPVNVDRSKIRTIPCGIDVELFKPMNRDVCRQQLGWDPDVFHILFQNSSDPVKQPALAYASVQALEQLGVKAQLHELRNIPYREVPIWLNASGVLLLTSLHEGSPTIVKESLACNVPIVSVDVGDVAERIHGINECYLAESSPGDLAAKLALVHAGIGSHHGREKIKQLSLDHVAQRLVQFYAEL